MKTKYINGVILINLVILLVYFNFSIVKKENLLRQGQLILLELAPVDPRSLMQGDYMRLNYSISNEDNTEKIPRGFCVVTVDSDQVARFLRFQAHKTSIGENETIIEFNDIDGDVSIGSESFFFEEGKAKIYDKARYGGLKVSEKGESILVGLYDKDFQLIE